MELIKDIEELRNIPVNCLPHTSGLTLKRFAALGLSSYFDLINYFPYRYNDFSAKATISSLQEGETVTIIGIIRDFKNQYARRGLTIQKATLEDASGSIVLSWFNQDFLKRILLPGKLLAVSGTSEKIGRKMTLKTEEFEILNDPNQKLVHTGKLVPVYSEKYGLSSKTVRDKINSVMERLENEEDGPDNIFPSGIIAKYALKGRLWSYRNIHFPTDMAALNSARYRLAFEELFFIQVTGRLVRKRWQMEKAALLLKATDEIQRRMHSFRESLPFKLTSSQEKAVDDIISDLSAARPMNRFLQGEVGSGKTVVAALAAYFTYLNGYRTILAAPTEILAQQHHQSISALFPPPENSNPAVSGSRHSPRITLLTGSIKPKRDDLEHADIVIGTHALLSAKNRFDRTALAIVDEQHRFGVKQRGILREKAKSPHLLTMTATPIPRTVALTLYGELDISYLTDMPHGRLPIKTYVVKDAKREAAYAWIAKKIRQEGIQAFIICPLIDESESETLKTVKAATKEFEYLKNKAFPGLKLSMVHGRMKPNEKNKGMADFKNRKTDILVATSVVEVGIDIPNATVIVIEGAERYGLAQLHQLRGRVGRGSKQSFCLVFTSDNSGGSTNRLNFFARNSSGLALAEFDMKVRGPGELTGTQQHGFRKLKLSSFADTDLIRNSALAAQEFVQNHKLEKFPQLKKTVKKMELGQIARD